MKRASTKKEIFLVATLVLLLIVIAGPGNADTRGPPCDANTVCIRNPLEFESLEQLLDAIIDFLIKIGAPLAVIMIIYAGFTWMFAAGEPEKISKARSIIIWTIVGYSIILVAKGILLVVQSVLGAPSP